MLQDLALQFQKWGELDYWIVISAALAGMACTIPGNYLLLRRQSMMGDALSHTSLLGIVLAFLLTSWLMIDPNEPHPAEHSGATLQWMMFAGAILVGILAAVLSEAIRKLGRVESSAALGVVFTTMFATGLLLMRLVDKAHIDVDCVLYGSILDMVLNTVSLAGWTIPKAVVLNGSMVILNLALVALFYKELEVSTFDPDLASAIGINSGLINYGLMAVTASTIVAVFESVGSILVIGMLIVPAATAYLLTSRLHTMIPVSLAVTILSAWLGHVGAIVVPPVLFSRLGFENVEDASTTGVIAATSGVLFFLALVFAPHKGLLSRFLHRTRLSLRVAGDDLLGLIYRMEELHLDQETTHIPTLIAEQLGYGKLVTQISLRWLMRQGAIIKQEAGYHLTDSGKDRAKRLVRGHRLWESYLAHHYNLSDERLHQSAHRIEHYLDSPLRDDLASELESPTQDPHGRNIPDENTAE